MTATVQGARYSIIRFLEEAFGLVAGEDFDVNENRNMIRFLHANSHISISVSPTSYESSTLNWRGNNVDIVVGFGVIDFRLLEANLKKFQVRKRKTVEQTEEEGW